MAFRSLLLVLSMLLICLLIFAERNAQYSLLLPSGFSYVTSFGHTRTYIYIDIHISVCVCIFLLLFSLWEMLVVLHYIVKFVFSRLLMLWRGYTQRELCLLKWPMRLITAKTMNSLRTGLRGIGACFYSWSFYLNLARHYEGYTLMVYHMTRAFYTNLKRICGIPYWFKFIFFVRDKK